MKIRRIIYLLIILAAIYFGWLFKIINYSQGSNDENVVITIDKGMGVSQVIDTLKEHELLKSDFAFKWYLTSNDLDTQLKPGTYELKKNMSIKEIVEVLVSGISYNEKKITLLDGWNLRQVADYLIKQGIIKNEKELYDKVGYPAKKFLGDYLELKNDYNFLSTVPQGYALEGFIYPDTYRVFSNATIDDVLKKVFDNFQNKFNNQIKEKLSSSDLNFYEILTLASIVAKEARTIEDKKMVAGVFKNRLDIGMGLQSDPTVNYVTLKVTDNPSLDDIATESNYNTYKYRGLPPTPISNPDIQDILAVIEPEKHDYLYFLNTKEGELVYAKTFEEHKRNRVKYGQ